VALLLTGCGNASDTTDKKNSDVKSDDSKDSVIFSISSEPTSLDPHQTKDTISYLVIFQMFDTLTREEPDGTLSPALAESWEFDNSGLELTLKIREGVKFHNGETMTPEDVAYSINRAIASSYTSAFTNTMESMEVVDDTHVKLILKERYAAVLNCLSSANMAIVNKKAAEEAGDSFAKQPVGTGPYKFVDWSTGEKVVMECFDDYWRGKAEIKNLTFKIHTDKSTAAIALEKGEVDVLYFPNTDDRQHLMDLPNVTWEEGKAATLYYVAFNCRDGIFANVNLRKAVCYALNRDAVITGGVNGLAIPTMSSIPMNTSFYKDFDGYDYNLEKAKEYLSKAGYPDGFTVKMKCNQSSQYSKSTEVIQALLADVGINVEIELMERAAYLEETQTACNYELTFYVITNNISDPDYMFTRRFHTSMERGGNNFTLHTIEGFNELIDSARGEQDVDKRQELYDEMNQIVYENAIICPLYQGMTYIAFNSDLQGVYTSPAERHYVYEYSWK
jgi:peptide/nickel transport system substrate-binding protein